MRISDWSSDVCSSDLATERQVELPSGGLARQTDTREQFSRFGDPDIDAADADEGLGTAGIAQKALGIERVFPVHQQRRQSAQFPAAAQIILGAQAELIFSGIDRGLLRTDPQAGEVRFDIALATVNRRHAERPPFL